MDGVAGRWEFSMTQVVDPLAMAVALFYRCETGRKEDALILKCNYNVLISQRFVC